MGKCLEITDLDIASSFVACASFHYIYFQIVPVFITFVSSLSQFSLHLFPAYDFFITFVSSI